MGRVTRALSTLAAALTALLVCAGPATATLRPTTPNEMYEALGLADMVTEYVVLVDVSASMAENDRYDSLRSGLRRFLGGLRSTDKFTLITFDADPHLLYHGPVTSVDDGLWGMPSVPKGTATDIGAALDEAVKTLEGTSSTTAGAIVLFTDAHNTPKSSSRYFATNGPAWRELERRGRALRPRVSGYVVPLSSGESGVDELRRTIQDTTVLELDTASQVEAFLGTLTTRVRRSMATVRIRAELAAPIEVSWSAVPEGADLIEGVQVTATLRSTTTAMPLEVVAPRATATGVAATVTGLPDRVPLAPGQHATIRLTVRADAAEDGFWYRSSQPRITLRLAAEVDTPWRDVLARELALPDGPPPLLDTMDWQATITSGLHPLLVVLPLGVLLELGMLLVFWWHRRNPYLSGSLVATTPDGVHIYRDLEGLRADRFPRPRTRATPDVRGEFRVRGVRRDGVVVPQVVYHPEGGVAHPPETCVNGHPTEVYGVSLYYTGQQR